MSKAEKETSAALQLQLWHRVKASKALRSIMAMNRQLMEARELKATKKIQQACSG